MLCMCNDIVMTFFKKEWFKNLRHCSFPFTMVFLVKRPPELLRVLCASHCPPHNVLHYMSDFPLYYNPLYYLTCFLSILIVQWKFANGCWLDRKLNSFLLLQPSLEPFVDDAHYFASIFEIRFCCLIIHIPISYIKSFLDCPRSGPGPVWALFADPGPGPEDQVQSFF